MALVVQWAGLVDLWVDLADLWLDLADLWVDLADLWEDLVDQWAALADQWEGQVGLWEAQEDPWVQEDRWGQEVKWADQWDLAGLPQECQGDQVAQGVRCPCPLTRSTLRTNPRCSTRRTPTHLPSTPVAFVTRRSTTMTR